MSRARPILLSILLLLAHRVASAADAEEEAAAAYDRGASAYDRGDFPTAATELARADELAPNDVTLELALEAASRSTDAVLAMTLVERAEKRPTPSERLTSAADAAKKRFASKVGTINVVCSNAPCEVAIDEKPVPANRAIIVLARNHRVVIKRGSEDETRDVAVAGGKAVEIISSARAPTELRTNGPPADTLPSHGVAPKWFWIATVVTVASGAATALSALYTARTHDEFTADRSNVELSNDGKFAEGRTVVLGVVTGALAVSTVVLGAVLVDFRRGNVALGPGAMRIRF
jgi:hypothetical protein